MDDRPPPGNDPAERAQPGGYLLAAFVLLASLGVVFAYWQREYRRETEGLRDEFQARAAEVRGLLAQNLSTYELVARGGVSLVASVARPSRQQWREYADGLEIAKRFPALTALGFSLELSPGELATMQQMLREGGEGLFTVTPQGAREHYGPVLYLEPRTPGNLSVIGYDMLVEPHRRAAMEAARDTGQPRLTAPLVFVQDRAGGRSQAALVLYEPVYRSGDRPEGLAARRESLQGWVLAAFRMRAFVDDALRTRTRRIWLRITDVTDGQPVLLYSDPGMADDAAAFRTSLDYRAYGRHWRLDFRSRQMGALRGQMKGLWTTLAVGVLASLLMFLVTLTLVRTRQRAEALAARMSESYRRSEQRFRAAMQNSGIGMALLDRYGRIVELNPALERIFGMPRERLAGTFLEAHFDPAPPGAPARSADGEGVSRASRVLATAGGQRQLQLTYAPVQGDRRQDVAHLVEVEDATERLRAQAQILALNRSLEARVAARTRELSRAKDELESFAYSVSHDLRAPLRAIDGFSRLLGERYGPVVDDAGREHIARVRNAAARMGDLIESLLKMARLGRGPLEPRPLDLGQMAREVVAELRAGDPDRRIAVDIEPGLEAVGDRGLVYNLLENLLGNAWKFTRGREDARIAVGRSPDGSFFVSDNGAGFDPGYANKLFRPFQRLHSESEFSGHGIGLASVKRIVERHGGTIRAEGEPGRGATFRFTLPAPEDA